MTATTINDLRIADATRRLSEDEEEGLNMLTSVPCAAELPEDPALGDACWVGENGNLYVFTGELGWRSLGLPG